MKVKICPKCSHQNSPNVWSCNLCGATLSVKTIVEVDDAIFDDGNDSYDTHTPTWKISLSESQVSRSPTNQVEKKAREGDMKMIIVIIVIFQPAVPVKDGFA